MIHTNAHTKGLLILIKRIGSLFSHTTGWTGILLLIILCSCSSDNTSNPDTTFTLLDSQSSQITFANNITENDTLNYFTFPYLYLGGGISVGDINNDGLTDIYFTGNQVPNKLYLNKGNLVFEDISGAAGVSGDERWYSGSTMVDINQDGWLDIYVSVSGKFGTTANQLFINQQDNTFREAAEEYGIADTGISIQSTFFDYDNDGVLDLFVANYPLVLVSQGNQYYKAKMQENRPEDSGHLYKNNGDGSFSDVTAAAGVQNFGLTLGIVAADVNNDGFTDLYLSNDFNVPDYLYQNNGDGTFTEISQLATQHTSMFGMGIDAGDINNDGWSDLIQLDMTAEDYKRSKTNMASMSPATFYEAVDLDMHYQYMQNALQLNNGTNKTGHPIFSDISRMAGMATTDWSWGVLLADLDNDGWKDVFITNGVKRDVNNNDVNQQYASTSFFGQQKNRDFRLMPSTPIANYAYQNNQDYTFTKVSQKWGLDQAGFSNGFALADLDNDGDLDLVINNMDAEASLYANETQQTGNHSLTIQLKGPAQNPFGLGTKVMIRIGDLEQHQELTLTRGYQSSMEPRLHIGLGKADKIDELTVIWPDGKQQRLTNVPVDQPLKLEYKDAQERIEISSPKSNQSFEEISQDLGIDHLHKEDDYDDFAFEPLLPHRYSQMGPALAVGDVNGDGLEDCFIGNAAGSPAAMFLQTKEGMFEELSGPWELDSDDEDTGALLFDADNDGDLDLYVVNGGNDILAGASFYQDRLYVNTEEGFVKSNSALPNIYSSGQTVVSVDYDSDGDLDLFVAGRIVPGKYPFPAPSYLLRNEGGQDSDLRFTDVTEELLPELKTAGLVTSAVWEDIDADEKPDLILAGEWMPIRVFRNTGERFEEIDMQGLGGEIGWWYSLVAADLDGDGDKDLMAGNLGLNYKYKASAENPFEVYANDFDENGSMDIVLSHHKSGTQVPLRGRECSSQQVPAIKARFETYELFADASLPEIYGQRMLDNSLHYAATSFAHYWFENLGDNTFKQHRLPNQAQFSSINAIQILDYNQDAYPDVLLAGNLYGAEVETPRADAGVGLILTGSASGEFFPVSPSESGLMEKGEIKDVQPIRLANGNQAFLFARNNLPLSMWRFSGVVQ